MSKTLSNAELQELSDLLNKKYNTFLKDRTFSVSSSVADDILHLVVTVANQKRTFVYPIEARVNFKKEDLDPKESAIFLVDYIDLYFEDFFDEDENLFIPIDWTSYEYEATEFQMRGQIFNQLLEEEADRLLSFESEAQTPEDLI